LGDVCSTFAFGSFDYATSPPIGPQIANAIGWSITPTKFNSDPFCVFGTNFSYKNLLLVLPAMLLSRKQVS